MKKNMNLDINKESRVQTYRKQNKHFIKKFVPNTKTYGFPEIPAELYFHGGYQL